MPVAKSVRQSALRLLAAREHSRLELQRKLRARGFDESELEPLIDDLSRSGLLNEERMAEAYVTERLRKGFGPVRIRQELRQRGLTDDIIGPTLACTTGGWLDSLSAAHNKRFGAVPVIDAKERARRARFLEYRGFPTELIADFLSELDP